MINCLMHLDNCMLRNSAGLQQLLTVGPKYVDMKHNDSKIALTISIGIAIKCGTISMMSWGKFYRSTGVCTR